MPKFQWNSFVKHTDTPAFILVFKSTIIYKSQKGLQHSDEWYKQNVTETQFSKGFPDSEFRLLPFQVSPYLVYLKTTTTTSPPQKKKEKRKKGTPKHSLSLV